MKTITLPYKYAVDNVQPNMFGTYNSKTWNEYDPATRVLTANNSTFVTDGVQPGMVLFNPEDSTSWATIQSVDSETELTLNGGFIYESSGGTRLSRFSIATAEVAFKLYCIDTETSKLWWANYKVGDRVQSEGQGIKTSFNKAVATIVEIEWDEVNDLAVVTLDKPLQTNKEIWLYKDGDVQTLPIEEVEYFFLKREVSSEGDSVVRMSFSVAGNLTYEVEPWLKEPQSIEEALSVSEELKDNLIDAVQEALTNPWPRASAMVKDSYGMNFRLIS